MDRIGKVETVKNEICLVSGLYGVGINNVVSFSSGGLGVVLGFDRDKAQVIMFKDYDKVKKGDLVRVSEQLMGISIGDNILGRVIDPLGDPLDGLGSIEQMGTKKFSIEAPAKSIAKRRLIDEPLHTGYLLIDSQIPVGLGQRELLLGEKQSGHNDIAVDIIVNQTILNTGVICVYVCIDADTVTAKRRIERISSNDALKNTVVILGRTAQAASLNFVAPMVGATIAEYFAAQGKKVLIIFDDLTRHAKVYRQLSLLLNRPASREAYPGDIFYLHSRLLERAGCFNDLAGGGSITALPIVETPTEESTDFITTNLMSITDGHILFRKNLANKGLHPSVDSGFSVSRLGGRAQRKLIRELSEKLRQVMIRFAEIERFLAFGTDLNSKSLETYEIGKRAQTIFNQEHNEAYSQIEEAVLLYFSVSNKTLQWADADITKVKGQLIEFMKQPVYAKIVNDSLLESTVEQVTVPFNDLIKNFIEDSGTIVPQSSIKHVDAEIETISSLLREEEKQVDGND